MRPQKRTLKVNCYEEMSLGIKLKSLALFYAVTLTYMFAVLLVT